MKKLAIALLTLFLTAGCASGSAAASTAAVSATAAASASAAPASAAASTSQLSILSPKGAPALSLIPVLLQKQADVTTVDGSDPLQAALVNPSPKYDVIIAPTNLGVKLAIAGKTDYQLQAVVSWGNLYIVADSDDALTQDGELALFGENATPGLVFQKEYDSVKPNITWYSSTAEASAALLSGKANAAMLAEPSATAAIAKAKENGKELKIIADLQQNFNGGEGYPQAGFFVRKDQYEKNPTAYSDLLEEMTKYANNVDPTNTASLEADINTIGTDTFGVASSAIVGKTWKRLGVSIRTADSVQTELENFLNLFGIQGIDSAIIH